MLKEFENILNLSLTIGNVLENLTVALICSLIIAAVYKWSYRGPGYSLSFLHSLIILSLITAIVIMVIGNNLARAFGLVGAMSIIRFRTPIKDAMDIVYIFFSLAIGMAAGVGLHRVAFIGTILVGLIILILVKTNLFSARKEKFLLQFHYLSKDLNNAPYIPIINRFCNRFSLVNIKSIGEGDIIEVSYYIDLKDKNNNDAFVNELRKVEGISNINLYFDQENL